MFEVDFSPALADPPDPPEEENVEPILHGTTSSRPTRTSTPIAPKPSESSAGSRPSPRALTPTPARRQRVTPARAIVERPLRAGASPAPSRQQNIKPVEILEPSHTPPPTSRPDAAITVDIPEDRPLTPVPPRTTINPSLLPSIPMIHLPMQYEPSFASSLETKDPAPKPDPFDLAADPLLPPLTSEYAASFYPLPPEKSSRKRKGGNKRTTVSGTSVVDLDRWEATMNVNPAARLARRSTKCITTREWEVNIHDCYENSRTHTFRPKIMYHEVRYLRALGKIQELKMAGRWSFRQPKKQRGPTISKTHWDYLLDEMVRDSEGH